MMTIWKYPVQVAGEQRVRMPGGARRLSVQVQHGEVALWALVDSDTWPVLRRLRLWGTGHPIKEVLPFVGTFQLQGGARVFHLFDGGEEGA